MYLEVDEKIHIFRNVHGITVKLRTYKVGGLMILFKPVIYWWTFLVYIMTQTFERKYASCGTKRFKRPAMRQHLFGRRSQLLLMVATDHLQAHEPHAC